MSPTRFCDCGVSSLSSLLFLETLARKESHKNVAYNRAKVYIHQNCRNPVTVVYSRAILVAATSECNVERVVCETWTGTFANSADPYQTPRNALSDQALHCLNYRKMVK